MTSTQPALRGASTLRKGDVTVDSQKNKHRWAHCKQLQGGGMFNAVSARNYKHDPESNTCMRMGENSGSFCDGSWDRTC